jgi:hypothetical protein
MTTYPKQDLISIKQQRLEILQLQHATFGLLVPPHIVIEIDQIQAELYQLKAQSGRYLARGPVLETEQPTPVRGLIVLISTLPVLNHPDAQSAFDAIDFHRTRLQHCWLIASGGERGSLNRAYELRDYFTARRITMHVWQVEDAMSIQETYRLVDLLYTQQVPAHDLAEHEVIADITGSTKPMTVGMVLACGTSRPIQYMLKQTNNLPSLPVLLQRNTTDNYGEKGSGYGAHIQ